MIAKILMLFVTFGIIVVGLTATMMVASSVRARLKVPLALLLTVSAVTGQWYWFNNVYNSPEKYAAEKRRDDLELAEIECTSTSGAFVMSQGFVKRSLKSPSTAVFPKAATSSSVVGKCQFVVASYVDSPNSFGAIIRTSYVAKLEYLPSSKEWQLLSLTM